MRRIAAVCAVLALSLASRAAPAADVATISRGERVDINDHLVKGKLTKANDGSWTLEDLDGGRTRAEYQVEASFGWMVPKALIAKGIETQLPKMLDAFKTRAESLHG